MKNIFVLPTNGESRVVKFKDESKLLIGCVPSIKGQRFHIYITNNEIPKGNEWGINTKNNVIFKCQGFEPDEYDIKNCRKIILATAPSLIADGVQEIDNDFLNWFVNNSSCEYVEVENYKLNFGSTLYKIILPKETPKQEQSILSIEDRAEIFVNNNLHDKNLPNWENRQNDFITGAKSMLPIIKELGEALKKITELPQTIGHAYQMQDIAKTALKKYKQYL